jgi:hypothetical protein
MSDTITISANDFAENEYLDSTMTIDTSMLSGSTITLGGAGVGSLASGSVYTTNNTGGYTFAKPTWQMPNESSIKIGEEFSIVASHDGPAKMVYKDQEIEIGQLFGMFNAFKTLLKSVADDPEFCAKHPEIRDMAYGYLVEELKR